MSSHDSRTGVDRPLITKVAAAVGAVFLLVGVLGYLVLWVYGLVIDSTSEANFVPLNNADNGLHLLLGLGMLALGFMLSRRDHTTATAR
jgi:hypothetical protein